MAQTGWFLWSHAHSAELKRCIIWAHVVDVSKVRGTPLFGSYSRSSARRGSTGGFSRKRLAPDHSACTRGHMWKTLGSQWRNCCHCGARWLGYQDPDKSPTPFSHLWVRDAVAVEEWHSQPHHAIRPIVCEHATGLTLVSNAEACRGTAVVGGEQQEEHVGSGYEEVRSLGTVVFTNQGGRCRGTVANL